MKKEEIMKRIDEKYIERKKKTSRNYSKDGKFTTDSLVRKPEKMV